MVFVGAIDALSGGWSVHILCKERTLKQDFKILNVMCMFVSTSDTTHSVDLN